MLSVKFEKKSYEFNYSELNKFQEFIELSEYFSKFEIVENEVESVKKSTIKRTPPKNHHEIFEEEWRKMFKNDKPLTLQQNMYNIKSIMKILDMDKLIIENFNDYENVIDMIWKQDLVDATKKNYLHTIMKLYKFFKKEHPNEYFLKVGEVKKQANIDHSFEATDKEKEGLIYLRDNVDDIRASLEKDAKLSDFNYQKYVLFILHVDFPCLRQEWGTILISDEDVEDNGKNYYNYKTSELVLNDYKNKTKKSMRVFINEKYPEVSHILDMWVLYRLQKITQVYTEDNEIPLFLSVTNKLLTKPTFNQIFARVFGKTGISTNVLRKFYISRYVIGNDDPEEILEINRIMCHSPNTCLTTYSKKF
jgi:hypothetical protein